MQRTRDCHICNKLLDSISLFNSGIAAKAKEDAITKPSEKRDLLAYKEKEKEEIK